MVFQVILSVANPLAKRTKERLRINMNGFDMAIQRPLVTKSRRTLHLLSLLPVTVHLVAPRTAKIASAHTENDETGNFGSYASALWDWHCGSI
jgi:hypothetical protein